MRILFACATDWSNVGYLFARSLQSVGVDADAVALKPHPFLYTHAARVVTRRELLTLTANADIVVNMHSEAMITDPDRKDMSSQIDHPRLVVFHGGSLYRRLPDAANAIFNPIVRCSLIQTGDLLPLGAVNPCWVMPSAPTDTMRPRLGVYGKKLIVAHYPRSPKAKGTDVIVPVLSRYRGTRNGSPIDLRVSTDRASWAGNIARMAACDVYVESLRPESDGRPFGSWGVTALEAAALGKVVITNFLWGKEYERAFGMPCPFLVANSADELATVMDRIVHMDRDSIENLQVDTREWVEKCHSPKATGERLRRIFERFCGPERIDTDDTMYAPPMYHDATTTDNSGNSSDHDSTTTTPSESFDSAQADYDPHAFWNSTDRLRKAKPSVLFEQEIGTLKDFLVAEHLDKKAALEIGPGFGHTYAALQRHKITMIPYDMVDISNRLRPHCKRLTKVLPDKWDGVTLPYQDSMYDCIIITDVLQHVPPDAIRPFLCEALRVMKSGGCMAITTYVGSPFGLAPHCFVHDYPSLFASFGLKIAKKQATCDGDRRVWIVKRKNQRPGRKPKL